MGDRREDKLCEDGGDVPVVCGNSSRGTVAALRRMRSEGGIGGGIVEGGGEMDRPGNAGCKEAGRLLISLGVQPLVRLQFVSFFIALCRQCHVRRKLEVFYMI